MKCLLQTPQGPLLRRFKKRLTNVLVGAFKSGAANYALALVAFDALERWMDALEPAFLESYLLPRVLPSLSCYLDDRRGEGKGISNDANNVTSKVKALASLKGVPRGAGDAAKRANFNRFSSAYDPYRASSSAAIQDEAFARAPGEDDVVEGGDDDFEGGGGNYVYY